MTTLHSLMILLTALLACLTVSMRQIDMAVALAVAATVVAAAFAAVTFASAP